MKVTVVDYGIGNLFSVRRALENCGAEVSVISEPAEIGKAERLVLPGVGAFGIGIEGLQSRGLFEVIVEYARSGRPFLGICLGMQLMMTRSEEFGEHEGLGLVPGTVKEIARHDIHGVPQKIPHIGWNELRKPGSRDTWQGSIMEDIGPDDSAYFVHSFAVSPEKPEHLLAECFYGGHSVAAALSVDNLIGCQFHPEKSGAVGAKILSRFLRLQ